MKRIARYSAIVALVLALLLAAGGWCLDRWMQSAQAHANIEQAIAEALHLPVKIESLTFSAWSGLKAKKISVAGPDGVIFEAAGISAGHRFSSLLRGSVALGEVRIEKPHFRLVEDASGKWTVQRTAEPGTPPPALTQPVGLTQPVAPPQPPEATAVITPTPKKAARFSIGKIIVEDGTAELFDKSRAPFATIQGLHVTLNDVTEGGFSGSFSTGRVTLHEWIAIDDLKGLANRTGQELQIRNLAADAGGGTITGEATWVAGGTGTASLTLKGIDLSRAAQDAGASAKKIAGVLSGDARLAGLGSDRNAITGKGTLTLRNGNCTQFEPLRQIGEVLRVASLANFEIADANAAFQIAGGQIIFAPLDVLAPPVGVTLSGPAAFDGTLDLAALLHAPADLIERQGMVADKFSPRDANNRRSVPFKITGSLKKPKQNLAESLTGTTDRKQQRIIAAQSILSALLQKQKPKPPEQPAQPAPAPQPAPAQQ